LKAKQNFIKCERQWKKCRFWLLELNLEKNARLPKDW